MPDSGDQPIELLLSPGGRQAEAADMEDLKLILSVLQGKPFSGYRLPASSPASTGM